MSYKNDPVQFYLKYSSTCKFCGSYLNQGQNVFYWPITKTIKCEGCGETEYKTFLAAKADEEVYNGTGNPYAG